MTASNSTPASANGDASAKPAVNGHVKEQARSTSSRPSKVESKATSLKATVALIAGILGTFLLTEIYKEQIAAYEFGWSQGSHHPIYPTIAVVLYLLAIYVFIPSYMKNREPKQFTVVKTVHNYILTVFSFVALVKALIEVYNLVAETPQSGFFWKYECLVCDSGHRHAKNNNLYFWFHVYYLSKFYELLDTAFICFTNKKPIFLHVYHHIITLWTIWIGMEMQFASQWIIMTANCLIHVFMYYYYMMQTLGVSVWWKRYLTSLQIFQFVVDETGILSWAYFVTVAGISCAANWYSFWYAFSVISSFLVLFMQFYSSTYSPEKKSRKAE